MFYDKAALADKGVMTTASGTISQFRPVRSRFCQRKKSPWKFDDLKMSATWVWRVMFFEALEKYGVTGMGLSEHREEKVSYLKTRKLGLLF